MEIFSLRDRTDRSPRRANESNFSFLDRTGSEFFAPVRELLQSWVDALPSQDQPGVVGNLSKGDDQSFDGAFWELYLHQLVTGSGCEVEVHPDVPGSRKHPDFLVHAQEPFYLEAVAVGTAPGKLTSDRRLRDVEAVLDKTKVDGWTLSFNWYEVGPQPLTASRLRDVLLAWLGSLERPSAGDQLFEPPIYPFGEDGWLLDFLALPVGSDKAPMVAIRGAGRAGGVNNKPGIQRVLGDKSRRYGNELPHPLVTAVLSNTYIPTRVHQIPPTLYGLHWRGPALVTDAAELGTEGHWRTVHGWRRSHNPYVVVGSGIDLYTLHKKVPWVCWRRSHNPYVVVGSGIDLYTLHKKVPWVWRTLDPAVTVDLDLPWAAAVDVTVAEPEAPAASPDFRALGITEAWCAGVPDFDVR